MAEQAAYSSEDEDAAVAATEPAGRDLTSSPPRKVARLDCKKHAAYSSKDMDAAMAAPEPAGRDLTLSPPLKVARLDCRKHAAAVDLSASGAVMGSSCFESMKASSPPHAADAELHGDRMVHAPELHGDWMEKCPSALAEFESVLAAANGKQIVMFLDYDGTLSPIVKDPDAAFMSEEMRDAVRGVAEHFPTAIVSGRCRDKVFDFVKLTELYYAGSHGMDIQGPANHLQGEVVHFQAGVEFLPVIEEVFRTLTAKMAAIDGAKVENNKYCLSVHYRCVADEEWDTVEEEVKSVLREYPNLKFTHGKKVLEIRPSINWDKGKALEFLLKSLGYAGCNDVFPIHIGDDRTDEDAFQVLRNMGQGIGILVSNSPKETAASYSLSDPAEVMEFLCKLAKSKGDTPTMKMIT